MDAKRQAQSRAHHFADLENRLPRDADPEDDGAAFSASDDEALDESADNAYTGKEHYQSVGKSRLRNSSLAALGPQYGGSRIGRASVPLEDQGRDPFAEYGSDEASDVEEQDVKEHAVTQDDVEEDGVSVSASEEEEERSYGEDQDADSNAETDDTDMSDAEHDALDRDAEDPALDAQRAELRKMMSQDQKSVATTIAQANRADAEKGAAVAKQRRAFDALLNCRIRLQQALIASNSLDAVRGDGGGGGDDGSSAPAADARDPMRAAEAVAVSLWTTLDALRQTLDDARAGTKRKRSAAPQGDHAAMWAHMQSAEARASPHWRRVLQKWSLKTAPPATATVNRLRGAAPQTILAVVDAQLAAPERLVARTRTPRSCAPLQAARGADEGAARVFDDADFYGQLLQELLERRAAMGGAVPAAGGALGGSRGGEGEGEAGDGDARAQLLAARRVKAKKEVDTRASKGRKLRYTVHEKLQNFMAPEDRTTWGARRADELFGSLLGRRMALSEDKEGRHGDAWSGNDGALMGEDEALRLFRS